MGQRKHVPAETTSKVPAAGDDGTAKPMAPCVEKGVWMPIPRTPPAGPLLLRLKDVDADESAAVRGRGVLSFHAVGCTGQYDDHLPETLVAQALTRQAAEPGCFGGHAGAVPASFFLHLGDIVYKGEDREDVERANQQKLYNDHFYLPYARYPKNIFALAGNHDGKNSRHPEKSPIGHFLENFCAKQRTLSPDNQSCGRPTMMQPYPYWVLRTPLAYVVCLYANDVNGGQLDEPGAEATPQYDWLVKTLGRIRKRAEGRLVLLAIHYPPYSGATSFLERGDPNLGPAGRDRALKPLGSNLQRAFRRSKQYPDLVLSAHAHHYQRITYRRADGHEIPYLIAGSGGHGPVERLAALCDPTTGAAPCAAKSLPAELVWPAGLRLPRGDRARLVAYDDRSFGFLRITIDHGRRTLIGEWYAVPGPSAETPSLPAVRDWFVLDLDRKVIV